MLVHCRQLPANSNTSQVWYVLPKKRTFGRFVCRGISHCTDPMFVRRSRRLPRRRGYVNSLTLKSGLGDGSVNCNCLCCSALPGELTGTCQSLAAKSFGNRTILNYIFYRVCPGMLIFWW